MTTRRAAPVNAAAHTPVVTGHSPPLAPPEAPTRAQYLNGGEKVGLRSRSVKLGGDYYSSSSAAYTRVCGETAVVAGSAGVVFSGLGARGSGLGARGSGLGASGLEGSGFGAGDLGRGARRRRLGVRTGGVRPVAPDMFYGVCSRNCCRGSAGSIWIRMRKSGFTCPIRA